MSEQHGVSFIQHAAAAMSRRGSLLTLGGAAVVSALARPAVVRAGEDGKKAKKRSRKTCRRQIDKCRNAFLNFCASEEAECEEDTLGEVLACCAHLSQCNAGAALDCLFATA